MYAVSGGRKQRERHWVQAHNRSYTTFFDDWQEERRSEELRREQRHPLVEQAAAVNALFIFEHDAQLEPVTCQVSH